MKNKYFLIFLSMLLLNQIIFGQNNLGDSKNDTPIRIFGRKGGLVSFNLVEKRIIFNYVFFHPKRMFFCGFEVSGTAKDKLSNIFKNGETSPETAVNFQMGIKLFKRGKEDNRLSYWMAKFQREPDYEKKANEYLTKHPITSHAYNWWLVFEGGYSRAKYNIFQEDNSFENQLINEKFSGYRFSLGINHWNSNILGNRVTFGASLGFQLKNNIDTLEEKTLEESKEYFDSSTNTKRIVKESKTVYEGVFDSFTTIPLNIDLFISPQYFSNTGFYLYSRSFFSPKNTNETHIGFGIFLFKNNDPLDTLGGIILEIPDVFDASKKNTSILNKIKINFNIGIKIPKL